MTKKLYEVNLYKYHTNPEELDRYSEREDIVPELVWDQVRKGKKLNQKQLAALAKSPKYAYQYAEGVINGRFPEGEKAIASEPYYAYFYAKDVIKGRFPEGEKAIASNSDSAYFYAKDVINGRFPEEK